MFKRKNVCKRVVAISLVFYFAFANCFTLLTTVSYAAAEELGKQQSDNFSNNIEYTVNFEKDGEDVGYEFEGSIEEEQLALHMQVEVKNEGYLKSSKILIESENGLSFTIAGESGNGYQVNGNQITLSNISAGEKIDIILPIKYEEKDDIGNLNKKVNVKLIGIYVNNNGTEKSISQNYILRTIWNTNTEFNITSELKKYIPFSSNNDKGIIVQTSVKSWIPIENNFVKEEDLEIETISLDGYKIEKILIAKKSGENLEETDWNYDEEENKINITLKNDSEKIESEEFLITYILSGEKELELPFTINSKLNGSIFMFGTDEKIDTELEAEYEVEEAIGNIVSVDGESTQAIKLGNLLNNKLSEENKYKTTYETKLTVDISSIDMVEGILLKNAGEEFENEEGTYQTNTTTYKEVSISRESFEKILGEKGKIEIIDEFDEVVSIIDKTTKLDNDQYKVEVNLNNINIKVSKPITEGVLPITITEEMMDSEYSYEQLKTFSNINVKYTGSVIYEGNTENRVAEIENKIELIKPETNSEITISRDTLSTIADNNSAQLEIKLNNVTEDVDLYKNPKFEIVFPEYIEEVNISNIAIANSENAFEIEDSSISKNEDGKLVLNINLKGEQTKYNTNTLSNGTSILVSCQIKLNLYAPTSKQKIALHYTNENATKYRNEEDGKGLAEVEVTYKAPVGLVSISRISNYENTGKTVTSVEQGKMTDKIEIFDDAKVATMDIIVMNNNENNCDNVKILGRIPFKGNKDVTTGEDLGTTIDTKLVSSIVGADSNLAKETIYYSTNGEATEDLKLEENKWTTSVENLSDVKSYLIVLEKYEMKPGETLKYTYKYEIPENLEHNTYIYGSFKTTFNNLNNVATVKEVSSADIVGLTTGVGPQLAVATTTNVKNAVKEYEKIKYTITVENTGTEASENIVVTTKLPTEATLAEYTSVRTVEEPAGWTLKADREIVTKIEKLNPGDIKKIEFFIQANKLPSIEEYYANVEGFEKNEDGSYILKETVIDDNGETKTTTKTISRIPEVKILCESTVTAEGLAKEIKVKDNGITVEKSNIVAEEVIETKENIAEVNETIQSKILIKNNSNEIMRNIVVTKVLPNGLNYSEHYVRGYAEDGISLRKIKTTNYDVATRTLTWTIDELQPGRTTLLIGEWVVGQMQENVYEDTISTTSTIKVNGEEYQAGQVDITVGRPNLEVKQTSNLTNQYIKAGDEIEYTFTIRNTGSTTANNVKLIDNLPNEVAIKKLTYNVNGIEASKVVSQNEDATIYTNINPNGKVEAKITVQAKDIVGEQKTISNIAQIESLNNQTIKSNKIENIIERTATTVATTENNIQRIEGQENDVTSENIKDRYEIKGTVWLDENQNGSRDNGENKIAGMEVKLLNAKNGEQVEKAYTNIDGEYKFQNLQNGEYIVIFYYDNTRLGIAEYKMKNVADNQNSDVITTTEDGREVATTDIITIKDGSKSNIDAGFVDVLMFDLSLRKTITKVTVQDNSGTRSYDFDDTDLAKVDINGKYLNNAKVLIEYNFTIKNEGKVDGYAKQIIDYMPKELEFNTKLNPNWYEGNDGNLYNEELANDIIVAGETKTIKLVLEKTMTEENTGIINNQAEISKDYNKYGIKDKDSTPNNGSQQEDDMSSADMIIGVQTGDTLIYISAIIAGMIAIIIIGIVIKKSKLKYKLILKFGKEV